MTTKVTICAYDSLDGVGGPFVWMQRMPPLLRERGIDVRVALYSWPGQDAECGIVFQSLRQNNIPVTQTTFADSEANVRWLLHELQLDPPDVLITDNVIPALLSRRFLPRAISTVGILRSDDDFYRGIADRFIAGEKVDRMSAVVCVSKFLEQRVIAAGYPRDSAFQIPSGTPTSELPTTRPHGDFRVAYVGRLAEEQKCISDVARVLMRIVGEIPGTTGTIYGDGPDRSRVEELLASQDNSVRLAGRLCPADLLNELRRTHVLILLSDYEGTPTAVMEAMACGVVPICLDIRSGIPDLVDHGKNGLLVEDKADSVISAVMQLQRDQKHWSTLSRNAMAKAKAEFSLSYCADRWAKVIEGCGGSAPKPFQVPRRLELPPPHPGYQRQDQRHSSSVRPCIDRLMTLARKVLIYFRRARHLMQQS